MKRQKRDIFITTLNDIIFIIEQNEYVLDDRVMLGNEFEAWHDEMLEEEFNNELFNYRN